MQLILSLMAALAWQASALAADVAKPAATIEDEFEITHSHERDQCRIVGATFYRLAEQRKAAGMVELYKATVACQKDHPGDTANGALSGCIKDAELAIVERVRMARIEVK